MRTGNKSEEPKKSREMIDMTPTMEATKRRVISLLRDWRAKMFLE